MVGLHKEDMDSIGAVVEEVKAKESLRREDSQEQKKKQKEIILTLYCRRCRTMMCSCVYVNHKHKS